MGTFEADVKCLAIGVKVLIYALKEPFAVSRPAGLVVSMPAYGARDPSSIPGWENICTKLSL